MKLRNLMIAAVGLTIAAGVAGAAAADTPWQATHARREQVNHRLDHLNRSITHERREGDISARRAMAMHAHVHAIRMHERRYAMNHRGHISRFEQARLNHQENVVRRHVPG